MAKKVIVTGCCGFIGSNFVKYLLTDPEVDEDLVVVNIDKQTYAGQGDNIEHMGLANDERYKLIIGDIADKDFVENVFSIEKPDIVFNIAAESHVDRSITGPVDFARSNILGTVNLLEAVRKYPVSRYVQISTDEVYGSTTEESFTEKSPLNPGGSPYAASKAAADLMVLSYLRTYQLPIIITRSANNYGPYQYPEKLLSLFITNLVDGKKVPLMWTEENPGLNVRDWLHVHDNCRGIWFAFQHGVVGEIYNIGGENERTNIEMTKLLLREFGFGEEMIEKVPHRKSHDFRYSVSCEKLKNLGFTHYHRDLEREIANLVSWYKNNENWWRKLINV